MQVEQRVRVRSIELASAGGSTRPWPTCVVTGRIVLAVPSQ